MRGCVWKRSLDAAAIVWNHWAAAGDSVDKHGWRRWGSTSALSWISSEGSVGVMALFWPSFFEAIFFPSRTFFFLLFWLDFMKRAQKERPKQSRLCAWKEWLLFSVDEKSGCRGSGNLWGKTKRGKEGQAPGTFAALFCPQPLLVLFNPAGLGSCYSRPCVRGALFGAFVPEKVPLPRCHAATLMGCWAASASNATRRLPMDPRLDSTSHPSSPPSPSPSPPTLSSAKAKLAANDMRR